MRTTIVVVMLLAGGCGTREVCDATNCAGGCCDTLGRCQSGLSQNACGNQGARCRTCSATETCSSSGVCVPGSIGTGGGSAGGSAAGGNVGGSGATCSTDAQCGTGLMCHPVLGQCISACATASECPSSARTCATFSGQAPGTGGLRGFCQCATDALCAAQTAGAVCQPITKLCSAKCLGAPCPTGLSCETASGHCVSGTTDGGTGGPCVPGSCQQGLCDPTTQRCATPSACSTANPQPDACVYGLVCSAAQCAEAPFTGKGCANFSTLSSPLAWDPATVTPRGPVTVSLASIAKDTGAPLFCGSRGADFSAEARLYSGSTTFPSALDLLPANFLNYVRSDGQAIAITPSAALVRPSAGYAAGLSNNNRNLVLKMNFCVTGAPASLVVGFYGENGNPVCATLQ